MKPVKIGDSLDFAPEMGPIVHSNHLAKIKGQINDLIEIGGTAHSSATLPDLPGNFIAPMLVTGVDSKNAQDEVFGPVGTIHTFKTEAEAVQLANDTPFGMEGYVFGADEERAMKIGRRIRAGGVKINGSTILSLSLYAPRAA